MRKLRLQPGHFLPLILLLILACSERPKAPQTLAGVGQEVITTADFKRAYIPVLLYSDKRESPATREEILSFLIDQSLLSQTARSLNLDTIPTLNVLRRTALKTAFTRILYHNQVRDRIPEISDQELRKAYRRSHTQRLVRHLFSEDSSAAFRMQAELEAGASWDSLASVHFKEASLAANGGLLGWMKFGDMDSDFEEAVYTLPLRTTSAPVKTRFGWHLIRAEEESRELMLTEYDYQLERSSLEQTLKQRREQSLAETAIKQMMDQAQLTFNEDVAARVWNLMRKQINRLLAEPDLAEIPGTEFRNFEELLAPLANEPMLQFSNTSWTVRDFLTHLPEMNRQLMLTDLKKATAFLVRDEVIFQAGLKQDLEDRADVQAEVRDRENQFLANLYLRYRASAHPLSPAAVAEFYRQQANTRYLAPDSLYIQEIWPKDSSQARELKQALATRPTLDGLRASFDLTVVDMGWFQGSRPDRSDYYHRLLNLPLETMVGPLDSGHGLVFIRAIDRRRHPKPLEQIREVAEQDAYEQWLSRLKLEETRKLKAKYSVTIDRELLLSLEF